MALTEAVVTFEYDAQQDDELTLRVGQVLKNVRVVDEGWAEGELFGKVGMFPDNFVEMKKVVPEERPPAPIPKEDRPPPPAPKEERPPPPIAKEERASVGSPSQTHKGKRLLRVTFEYNAINDDELTLKIGDLVEFLADDEEGWYKGQVKGKIGVFPSNFVEEASSSTAPSGVTSTDGKQTHSATVSDHRPSKPPPPIPSEGGSTANHHADTAPPARPSATFGGKQVLPMGELPIKPSDLKKRPPPQPVSAVDKPDKPFTAPPTSAKPKKEAPPPPSKRDRPPVMPKTLSKQDLASVDHPNGNTSTENDFEGLPDHRLLEHPQRAKGPPRKPPSQSRLVEGRSPESEEEPPAASKPPPTWARRSFNAAPKPSEPPARPASVKQGGPPRMEPKPSPPPAGPSAGATQSNTELVAALDALKLEFKKLREEYRKDIDTLMADLDQERKKVRSLEVDVDRLKKRYHREN